MPRQDSKRGIQITGSNFEAPFETHLTRFGTKGLNINDAIDVLEPTVLSRMVNVKHKSDFSLTARPGMTELVTSVAGSEVHSICRLNDPTDSTYLRIFGINGHVYTGNSGALTQVDTGYSGDPLHMVPYRPPHSAETWMYLADRLRMRKVRTDGLDLPIGLPAPVAVPTAVHAAIKTTPIALFQMGDGTDPPSWTGTAGAELEDTSQPSGAPTTSGGEFLLNPGSANAPYYSFWGLARPLDLSVLVSSGDPSSDDDFIGCSFQMSHPHLTEEVRLYFICSPFDATVLPGSSAAFNTDAYVKSFRGNDQAAYLLAQQTVMEAAEQARIRAIRDDKLREQATDDDRDSWADRRASIDTNRQIAFQGAISGFAEFGQVGLPLRRGDFQRIGNNSGYDWSTITGMIVYVQGINYGGPIAVTFANMTMYGGDGPDTAEPGCSKYDYRYTNYDPRTGVEGNPCEIMDDLNHLDALRRQIDLTPVPYGDTAIRQRFYRRGGTLVTDWFYLGENDTDGGVFNDDLSDAEIEAAGSVELDNYQPVPTVDEDGETVLAQPVASLFGPHEDLLFACGDPYRPGDVYWCKPGNPDSWPDDYHTEVCAPSEQLMTGCTFGGQAFVFSKERLYVLYPNQTDDSINVTATPTQCKKGMINRWGLTVGIGGMYFVATDGIYRTLGGPEEWLSKDIDPLFTGKTRNDVYPIDFSLTDKMRLEIFENELYFQYHDTDGGVQCMVLNLATGAWRQYTFGVENGCFYRDEGNDTSTLLIGGLNSGEAYTHTGYSDDGTAIACQFRNGALHFNHPREEKRLGDQFLDIDTQGVDITLQNRVNDETIENDAQGLSAAAGRTRAIFDSFGEVPQRVRNITTDISWESDSAAPIVYQMGTSVIIEPDVTINRVTQWEDLGHPDESYLMGVTFDCDTGGEDRTIIIEYDWNGVVNTAATLTVNCDERHKVKFSWTAVQAHKVRIRPNDDCQAWILYKADWISVAEPPRVARWDIHFENGWDQYYTGLDIYCDTNGLDKTIEVYVDGTLIATETVNTNGRRVHHITLPWGRGHVFRFRATDDNPGLLYEYRWHLDAEPSEQANWNQNFTVAGTEADKYLKAIVFQCDTFGANKTVTVECDGVVVETLSINSNGRKVVQRAFPQHLGRVFRIYPTDGNPGRLYSLWWVFDQEPLALDRWETQEITHGMSAWHYPIFGHVTLKSTAEVELTVTAYNQSGQATIRTYTIPSTDGDKVKNFVGFFPTKGVLYKYVLTSVDPFWLYREETVVKVREWGSNTTIDAHVFGNDDMDVTRGMSKSELAAARSGGNAS